MLRRVEYKWYVAAIYVFALFMDYLDSTVTNVALPTLARQFQAGPTTIEWVITAYLLALAVAIPVSGWMGDRFGTKRTFLTALGLFTLGSGVCATAPNVGELIAFRALQGVGGGLMVPVGAAMLYRAFPPEERARAAAFVVGPTVLGPTSGPLVGGYLAEYQGWHWIFLVNVPIGLLAFVSATILLQEQREAGAGRLDLPGFLLASTGFTTLLYALAEVGPRGLGDRRVLGLGLVGLVLVIAFVLVELRVEHPMIDLRLFRDRLFAAGNVLTIFSQATFTGFVFLMPLLLQEELGMGALRSGAATFTIAIGVGMSAPLVSRIYHRIGPRKLLATGMGLTALSSLSLVAIGPGTSDWWIRLLLLPRGWAFGVTVVVLQAISYATISSERTGRATAAQGMVGRIASSLGIALLATVLSYFLVQQGAVLGDPAVRDGAVTAFHRTFLVAALLGVGGLTATLMVDDRLAAHTRRRGAPAASVGESVDHGESAVPLT